MDDLISRQDAIDACIRVREHRAYDEIEEIEALPSAQSESQWIPCSKKLPEKDGEYLVTDDSGGAKWVVISQFIRCEDGSIYWDYANVTAWMPLPTAYREDGGE